METSTTPMTKVVVGLFLRLIVFGLQGYTWYIYVFRICVAHLIANDEHRVVGGILIGVATFLVFMASICYTRIILSDPGHPAQETGIQEAESGTTQSSESQLPQYSYSPSLFDKDTLTCQPIGDTAFLPAISISEPNGMPRFCAICNCVKPDRSHHCLECNICVLKMDHHCPWINNCVGHHNYKFFFLFVCYTGLYGIWCLGSGIPLVVISMNDQDAVLDSQCIAFLVLALVIGLTLSGFSIAHLYYILTNRTTIEHLSTRPEYVRVDFDSSGNNFKVIVSAHPHQFWNIGKLYNWRTVMGKHPIGWFLPVYRFNGGCYVYPYNDKAYHQILEQAKQQENHVDCR